MAKPKKTLMKLRLPDEHVVVFEEIARVARMPVDAVVSVVMATYIVRAKLDGRKPARRAKAKA